MQQRSRAVAFLVLAVTVGLGIGAWAQGAPGSLGVDESAARGEFVNALARGNVPAYTATKAFRAAPPATREAAQAWLGSIK